MSLPFGQQRTCDSEHDDVQSAEARYVLLHTHTHACCTPWPRADAHSLCLVAEKYSDEAIAVALAMYERIVDLCTERTEFIAIENGQYCKPNSFGAATILQGQCSPEVMEEAKTVLSTQTPVEWRAAFVNHTLRTRLSSFCMNARVASALGFELPPCTCDN